MTMCVIQAILYQSYDIDFLGIRLYTKFDEDYFLF